MAELARLPVTGHAPQSDADIRVPRLRTRFYAFLSYSHKDKELADWLHRELERFRVPNALAGKLTANGVVPRRLTPIFRDQHDLSAGGDLAEEIKAALAASQFLVVLCSPTAARSTWTNLEIESFKRTRPESCVIAAIADGEPFASDIRGREEQECFPPALRYKYDRRGHRTAKRADPLAADFRDVGEGRRLAFLKLVAGMLGVGLDELVQRDQTRRQRHLAYLAAASIAGMAVTSTLAVTAFQARNEARDQRKQAEALVAFMVGDLRDKLEPIGRLDVLDGVGARVLAYYSKQDASALTDDALLQRSRALSLMGKVAFDRGDLPQAAGLYRQATAGSAEAVRRAPDNAQAVFDHAQNVFYAGEVARFAGRASEAEAAYRDYQQLANRMVALQPDNLKYRMEVFYANEDVGISTYYQHRFAEAKRMLDGAADPMEKLVSIDPANATYQKEYATLLAWNADVERSLGHLDAASVARERQIAVLERLSATIADTDVGSRLATAHEGLAVVLAERGQVDRSGEELQTAINAAEKLIAVEPQNAQWKSVAADAHLQLGLLLLSVQKGDQAAQQVISGCALASALPGAYAQARTRLAISCEMASARLALLGGDTAQASQHAERALAAARGQHSQDPATDRYRIAMAYRMIGDIRQQAGTSAEARVAWNAGLSELPHNITERPFEMNERVALLRRLGRDREAAPFEATLKAIGYRPLF